MPVQKGRRLDGTLMTGYTIKGGMPVKVRPLPDEAVRKRRKPKQ